MIAESTEKSSEKTMEEEDIHGKKQKTSDDSKKVLSPEELKALMRAQIDRNNEWIEKMSPVIKYKIQEYVRKQKAKKMQRRKFSLACGLMNRVKHDEPPTSSAIRRRNRRVNSALTATSKPQKTVPEKPKDKEEKKTETKTVTHRRKSAPVRMDLRDLDDLE